MVGRCFKKERKMSHLLASINKEASDAIHPEPARPRLPGVGEMVVYHMRAGHGRNGKTFFPAVVQGHGDRDTLMLTVIIDAGDLNDESLVEERQVGTEFHCWERPEPVRTFAERIEEPAGLRSIVATNEANLDRLRDCVLGEFDWPKVSLVAILADFENRLRAVKLENDELRNLIGAAVKIKK
jgi:hypothetical protein